MATRASKKKEMKSLSEGGVFDLKSLDLGDEFVTAQDYTYADVKDWVPTGIPEVDSALTGGLPWVELLSYTLLTTWVRLLLPFRLIDKPTPLVYLYFGST